VNLERSPTSPVRRFMTAPPVTTGPDTPVAVLARQMSDAHIHRLIVVDRQRRPVGIVTSSDVLAAVGRC
jgi:CBS domain-containing protein